MADNKLKLLLRSRLRSDLTAGQALSGGVDAGVHGHAGFSCPWSSLRLSTQRGCGDVLPPSSASPHREDSPRPAFGIAGAQTPGGARHPALPVLRRCSTASGVGAICRPPTTPVPTASRAGSRSQPSSSPPSRSHPERTEETLPQFLEESASKASTHSRSPTLPFIKDLTAKRSSNSQPEREVVIGHGGQK